MKGLLLLTAALVVAPVLTARAGVIPTETSVSGSGPFTWSYDASVESGLIAYSGIPSASGGMNSGAFFTIYDFAGFLPGTCVSPTGWGCSTQNTGLTPATTLPTDDPNITNITWSYLNGNPLMGGFVITGFSAMSDSNVVGSNNFAGAATRANGQTAGTAVADIGMVNAPGGGTTGNDGGGDDNPPDQNPPPNNGGSGVPEPGTLGLLGAALAGLGFTRRRGPRPA